MKTLTLDVRAPADAMADFTQAWSTGKAQKTARISFATPELLWRVLTQKRWELLKVLCGAGPVSIREAARRLGNERLVGTTLYVTLEPCTMCVGAIAFARIKRVVYAAADPKGGAVAHGAKFFEQPTCHHRPEIVHAKGEAEEKASILLKDFFRARRQ